MSASRSPREVVAYTHPAPTPSGGAQEPDTQPGDYYVSCYDKHAPDLGTCLLLGPFKDDHAKALAHVDAVRAFCCTHDGTGKAPWMAYGTVRLSHGSGKRTPLVLGESGEVAARAGLERS